MSKLFGRLLVLVAIVLAAAVYQFNQVSVVEDPALVREAESALNDQFRSKTMTELSESLRSGEAINILAGQAGSLITQDVTLLAVRESRTLLPWKRSAEVILQVDFVLEERGSKIAAGRRYLRFAPTIDHGWRYLGETGFEGFYANLL